MLVNELVEAGLLVMEDVPGALPRYSLRRDFDWDGRYLLFARSASVWLAAKAGPPDALATVVPDSDAAGEDEYGRDAPTAFDRAWSEIRANVASRGKPSGRPPSLDEAMSRLLNALFKGTSFKAPNGEALNAAVSAALQIPVGVVALILAPFGSVPRVVRRVDEVGAGCRIEVDPELTWDALAAYPKTQDVCERFLELR